MDEHRANTIHSIIEADHSRNVDSPFRSSSVTWTRGASQAVRKLQLSSCRGMVSADSLRCSLLMTVSTSYTSAGWRFKLQ